MNKLGGAGLIERDDELITALRAARGRIGPSVINRLGRLLIPYVRLLPARSSLRLRTVKISMQFPEFRADHPCSFFLAECLLSRPNRINA